MASKKKPTACGAEVAVSAHEWREPPRSKPLHSVCILARGCEHAGLYIQMVGRVMRPFSTRPGSKRRGSRTV